MLAGITCESSGQGQGCSSNMASSLLEESELGWSRHSHELTACSAREAQADLPALQGASGEVLFSTHPYHA